MTEKQILMDIIQEFTNLKNKDNYSIKSILDKSHRKLVMVVERKFGRERDYKNQLEKIQNMRIGPFGIFGGMTQSSIDNRVREDLIKKSDRYLNLIDTVLEELKIEKNNEAKGKIEETERDIENQIVEERLTRILIRFHRFSNQLIQPQGKSTIPIIEIQNEYDVQDLLHAILKLEFDDVRAEEYTPSYAGSNSRMDFLLKKEEIVIEVKKTSKLLKDKEIGVQLNDDIAKYQHHPNCRALYCFIYDPQELISNPDGLQNDLSQDTGEFKVKVIITPKR